MDEDQRYDFVSPQELDSIVFCKICKQIAHVPVNFRCKLSFVYCKSCATKANNATSCIACNKACNSPAVESAMINEILTELKVYCFNKHLGCVWQGEQHTALDHLEKCGYYPCPRKQRGCSWRGKQVDVSGHSDTCGFVIVPCPHGCEKDSIQRNSIESHEKACPVVIDRIQKEMQKQREEEEERTRLIKANLEKERRKAQEATGKEVLAIVKPDLSDIVRINVGGKLFMTSRRLLTQEASSVFFSMLVESEYNLEEEKGYFVDRDPQPFEMMLKYLRCGSVAPQYLEPKELHALLIEGMYWCIKPLVDEILDTLQNKHFPDAEITNLRVTGRNYNGWRFKKVSFSSCVFDNSSFDNGEIQGTFNKCSFAKCSMVNTNFKTSKLSYIDFAGANLETASLFKATITNTNLESVTRECKFPRRMLGEAARARVAKGRGWG